MEGKENKRPLILVCNDDGYSFNGIQTLIAVARKFGDVVVSAPTTHQSGKGGSITIINPVRAMLASDEPGLKVYLVSGTPTDCVKLALNCLLDGRTPDLVLSGINHGYNVGMCVFNSGTIGAAIEGCVHGIPSVAFSYGDFSHEANVSACVPWVEKVIENVLQNGLPHGICLNVNIPLTDRPIKGFKPATNGMGRWLKEYEKRVDPFGNDYYWMTGTYQLDNPDDPTADITLLKQDYVTIAPCTIDITAHDFKGLCL